MSAFGEAMRSEWTLDPAVTHLNHGAVGAPPRRVLEAQQRIRDEIERHPSRFLLRELTAVSVGTPREEPRLRAAASEVAAFLGARGEDLVFVDNATTGVNAVLASLDLRDGDEILVTDHAYGAIANSARFVARRRGATVRTAVLPHPPGHPARLTDAVASALGPRTRIAVVDHVASESALVFPVSEIAARCRAAGVPLLVDGAHAPGMLPLDLPSLGAGWYVGNLHKWAFAPRSSGVLWAAPERQAGLHPTVISWGLDRGFTTEFDWVGTRDPSPHLAAPSAIAFLTELGAGAVRAYNHGLALEAARHLARRWGTSFDVPESMIGSMATVPLPGRLPGTDEGASRLRDALLFEEGIDVELHAARGRLWVRISAQIYNEMADYERLAAAVLRRS
ncbi:MAG TPA: aminotransferase class V-fold PLP-dependent enzyme [Candidatus Eisenbacteria bacterium]|jgi:isopenicillin-N epimerase